MKLSSITRRLHSAVRLMERPAMLSARVKGIPISTYEQWNQNWIKEEEFLTVLDIGANVGQFAKCIHAILPKAKIVSFEPLPDCFRQLQQTMGGVANFEALNIGLGERSGSASFEHNAFAPSSSFLKMTEAHKSAFPFTRESRTVTVQVERLDDLAPKLGLADPLLVKIDVQGYEDRVIDGGQQTFRMAKLVVVETSFKVLYEGQANFKQIYTTLTGLGFDYIGAMEQLLDPITGRVLQADSMFLKR